jgi:hypothetical protein
MKTQILSLSLFLSLLFPTIASAAEQARQYYELRVYTTKSDKQQKQIIDYWQNAAVPAYNRLGSKPIGVFTPIEDSPTNKIYVLIPFDSLTAAAEAPTKLAADTAYQKAAEEFMAIPKNDPAYVRFDSSLLAAMKGFPKIAAQPGAADHKPWIFELRTYLSHNEAKGANKVEMFEAGEIDIMKEIGLNPVFFSQSILGSQLPNLVYMVSGENMDDYKKVWKGFGPHPKWKQMSGDPKWKDNVSAIQSVFLKRTPASQI